MKFGSIYTVTLNPSIDYITKTNGFTLGETNRTVTEHMFPGGKGINVSIVLNNLGIKSTILGFEAGFTGAEIKRLIRKYNCHEELIHVPNGISRINVKIEAEDETELNGMGPEISKNDLDNLLTFLDTLCKEDILILAGSIPRGVSKTIYQDIISRVSNKGVYTIVDATGDLLLNTISSHPFLVKPNAKELGALFNASVSNKQDAVKYATKLVEMGAQNALVSMGGYGAVLVTNDFSTYKLSAPSGKLINSVGAGDSMIAGFIYGLSNNDSIEDAFKYAVCAGSASAFSENLATKDEVEALYLISDF